MTHVTGVGRVGKAPTWGRGLSPELLLRRAARLSCRHALGDEGHHPFFELPLRTVVVCDGVRPPAGGALTSGGLTVRGAVSLGAFPTCRLRAALGREVAVPLAVLTPPGFWCERTYLAREVARECAWWESVGGVCQYEECTWATRWSVHSGDLLVREVFCNDVCVHGVKFGCPYGALDSVAWLGDLDLVSSDVGGVADVIGMFLCCAVNLQCQTIGGESGVKR